MLYLICCVDEKNGIGKNNQIPWTNHEDQLFFKEKTINHCVVMGFNTYLSLNKKPLKNRENIVIVKEKKINENGFIFETDINKIIQRSHNEDIFIIGGSKTFNIFNDFYDFLIINEIKGDYQCDSFLEINRKKFKLIKSDKYPTFTSNLYQQIILKS